MLLMTARRHPLPRPSFAAVAPLCCVAVALGIASSSAATQMVAGEPAEGLILAVQSGDAEHGLDLWRARISDGALQRVSATEEFDERWPRWSQDAGRVAFLQRSLLGMMRSQVILLDPKTGERRNVRANPDLLQRSHVWSPDGKYVAHTFRIPPSTARETTNAGTVFVDIAAGEREIVSESEEIGYRMQSLAYSHDGETVVAHGRNPKISTDDELWLLKSGQKPRKIHGIPNGIYGSPSFTPDDKAVLFDYQQVRNQNRDIMMIEIGVGKRAQRIASRPRSDENTAIVSPKRNEMVILSDHVGTQNLMLVDLATGKSKILTKDLDRAATSPVWSPDGERLAYVSIPKKRFEKSQKNFDEYLVHVIDRTGKELFKTAGTMPSFMPPWKGDQPVASYAESNGKGGAAAAR